MAVENRQSGLTMIELMVTIAVVAILAFIAVPSFQNYIANQRVRSSAADLLSAMNFARSEAIKRNLANGVSVSPVTAGDWTDGWTVDIVGGALLRTYGEQSGVVIDDGAGGVPASITYGPDGRLAGGANVNYQITEDPEIAVIDPRCVRVGLSGKPAATKGAC